MAAGESGQTGHELALPRVPDPGTDGAAADPFVPAVQPDSVAVTTSPASVSSEVGAPDPWQDVLGGLLGVALLACALLAFRLRGLGREAERLRQARNEARCEADRLQGEMDQLRRDQRATIDKHTEALADENRALRRLHRELKESRTRLEAQAIRDELTGLLLRRAFEDVLDREVRRALRDRSPITVIAWTLDESHLLADRLGAERARRVIQRTAAAIESACRRGGDRASRIGPNAFAAVLPGTSLEGAAKRAEQVRGAIRAMGLPNPGSRADGKLTASSGLVQPDPATEPAPDGILAAVEAACTEAARRGGDQTVRVRMQPAYRHRAVG
jgi:diguanylate cyclase (GGDEF)-like protein